MILCRFYDAARVYQRRWILHTVSNYIPNYCCDERLESQFLRRLPITLSPTLLAL